MSIPKQHPKPWKLKSEIVRNRYIFKYKYPVRDKVLSIADSLSEIDRISVDEVKFHLDRTADIYIHTTIKHKQLLQILTDMVRPKCYD